MPRACPATCHHVPSQADIVPVCRELGIGFLAYSPLGRGMLTGAVKDTSGYEQGDFRVHMAPRFAGDNLAKVRCCWCW